MAEAVAKADPERMEPGTAKAVRWLAAITGMMGGVLLAINVPISGWGFVFFAVSSAAWVVAGYVMHVKSLIAVNTVLLLINCVGIWRWLL
jgi:hypothetical protein